MDDERKNPYEGWKPADVNEYEFLKGKRQASGNQVQLSPQGGPKPLRAKARWELEQRQRDSTYTRADAARLHELERNYGLKETTAGEDPIKDARESYDRAQRAWGGARADAAHRAAYRRQQLVGGADNVAKLDALQGWYKENSGSWGDVLSSYGMTKDDWGKLDARQRIEMGSAMLGLERQADGSYKIGGVDQATKDFTSARNAVIDWSDNLGFRQSGSASDVDKQIARRFAEIAKSPVQIDPDKMNELLTIPGVSAEAVASWRDRYDKALVDREKMKDAEARKLVLPYQLDKSGAWVPTKR